MQRNTVHYPTLDPREAYTTTTNWQEAVEPRLGATASTCQSRPHHQVARLHEGETPRRRLPLQLAHGHHNRDLFTSSPRPPPYPGSLPCQPRRPGRKQTRAKRLSCVWPAILGMTAVYRHGNVSCVFLKAWLLISLMLDAVTRGTGCYHTDHALLRRSA